MITQVAMADEEALAGEVTETLDHAWRQIQSAMQDLVYVQGLVENTTLKYRFGLLIKAVRKVQFAFTALVTRWDMIPEASHVRQQIKDTEASTGLRNATHLPGRLAAANAAVLDDGGER